MTPKIPSTHVKFLTLCSAAVMSVSSCLITASFTAPVVFAQTQSSSSALANNYAVLAKIAVEDAKVAQQAQTLANQLKSAAVKAKAYASAHPTSTAAAKIAAQKSAAAAAAAKAAAAKAAAAKAAAAKAAAAKAAAAKAAAAAEQSQKYKDGTYTGVGQTRIGAVQVQVTLKADKITSVQITGYSTHYSISYIDPILPKQLMQTQDVNKIQVVSGATLSTEDFYYAVQDCLHQASQANTA